jgi:hypothetical protein
MNFYYRSLPNGRCEVVCARCFLTLGTAKDTEDIWRIEDIHHCRVKSGVAEVRKSPVLNSFSRAAQEFPHRLVQSREKTAPAVRSAPLLLAIAFFLYVLPTAFEFSVLRSWNPWLATLLPGDLAGCACLILIFRKSRAGITLYFLLTTIEACLFWLQMAPLALLPWLTDLVPTLVVSGLVLRSSGPSRKLTRAA